MNQHSLQYFFPALLLLFAIAAGSAVFVVAEQPVAAQQVSMHVISENDTEQRRGTDIFAEADLEIVNRYIPAGGAPFGVFSFLLQAGGETILFDAGIGGETWVKNLEKNVKPDDVKLVLLTHLHGDHIGGLLKDGVRRFPNAKVLCSAPEYDYWLPEDATPRTPQIERIKTAYGRDFATFNFDDEVVTNTDINIKIKALDAAGHTPGHTVFLIEFPGGHRELILGDLLHVAALQFAAPGICSRFDMDKEQTVIARKRILDFAALEKIPVRGMHLPGPVGMVEKNAQDGYNYTPF